MCEGLQRMQGSEGMERAGGACHGGGAGGERRGGLAPHSAGGVRTSHNALCMSFDAMRRFPTQAAAREATAAWHTLVWADGRRTGRQGRGPRAWAWAWASRAGCLPEVRVQRQAEDGTRPHVALPLLAPVKAHHADDAVAFGPARSVEGGGEQGGGEGRRGE